MTIWDSGNYIGALYHTTITGWGVHLRWRHQRFFEFASRSVALRSCVPHVLSVQTMTTGQPVGRFSGCSPFTSSHAKHSAARLYGQIAGAVWYRVGRRAFQSNGLHASRQAAAIKSRRILRMCLQFEGNVTSAVWTFLLLGLHWDNGKELKLLFRV